MNIATALDTTTIMIVALNQAGTTEARSTSHRQDRDKRGLRQL
jgi:hypothetical protein